MVRRRKNKPRSLRGQELPGQIQLPSSLQGAGDPVDGNPFPVDHPNHKVWADATVKAEEEVCRLNSEFLARTRQASDPVHHAALKTELWVAKFNIWAKRTFQVVSSREDVRQYDQWLFNYASGWLELCEKSLRGPLPSKIILAQLKSRLLECMELWKAAARKYQAALEDYARLSKNEVATKPSPGTTEIGKNIPGGGKLPQSQPGIPFKRGGRPRKDQEREKVGEKKAAGKEWKDIAREMNAETGQNKSVEAYRGLLRPAKIKVQN